MILLPHFTRAGWVKGLMVDVERRMVVVGDREFGGM